MACGTEPGAGGVGDDAAAGGARGAAPPAAIEGAIEAALEHLDAHAARLGLRGRAEIAAAGAFQDALGIAHARFRQLHGGVPVFGGEAIVHVAPDGTVSSVSSGFVPGVAVRTDPALAATTAIDRVVARAGCRACLTAPPAADLWILRRHGRDHLVWRVRIRVGPDRTGRPALPVVFVDAHDGAVVWEYDDLQTGTGPSLYSGTLLFQTELQSDTYYLEDVDHHFGTFDMRNGTTAVFRFDDPDDTWDAAPQRAALDAHHGARAALRYLDEVHGRDGLDGAGGPAGELAVDGVTGLIASRVHYGSGFNNAFWDGTRVTYGDGDGTAYGPLVALDLVGHELAHGVTQFSAGLIYAGESGALNESFSDVLGALIERSVRGDGANRWKLGEDCLTPAIPGDALRHLDTPHAAAEKGFTPDDDPDHYSERYLGPADNGGVHINSGIANKAFHLVAMGGTHHLGGAMTGIGPDRAGAIWYRALTAYLTAGSDFARAARATHDAAASLYGATSDDAIAVRDAWAMVGVPVDLAPPAVAIAEPTAGATVAGVVTVAAAATDDVSIARVELLIDGALAGTVTAPPYAIAWSTAAGANGPHTLAARAYDGLGQSTDSATITVTVENDHTPPAVAITAPAAGATVSDYVAITADASDDLGVARVELLADGRPAGEDYDAPWELQWSSYDLGNGPHVLTVRAYDAAGNATTSAPLAVIAANPGVAAFDAGLGVPRCAAPQNGCDTARMLDGRDGRGPEPHAPNTLGGTCADGTGGTYHTSESIDRLRLYSLDGAPIAAGVPTAIEASLWIASSSAVLDLYVTTTPAAPSWTLLTTVAAGPFPGPRTVTATVALPEAPLQAIRAQLRTAGTAAQPCAAGAVHDRDDLVLAVAPPPDVIAPTAAITAPAAGALLAGTATVTATAEDNTGVVAVELYVDGTLRATDTAAPYSLAWSTLAVGNGPHALQVVARDAAGNTGASATVGVTVDNGVAMAVFDPALQAPRCALVADGCDTGALVDGRAGLGPEPGAPNTLLDACADGTAGSYHSAESIDRLRVFSPDGTPLAAGRTVTVEATLWVARTLLEVDALELYTSTAPGAPNPGWTHRATIQLGGPQGRRVVTASITLPAGGLQAIRANLRRRSVFNHPPASACSGGAYDDRDDVVFAVGP